MTEEKQRIAIAEFCGWTKIVVNEIRMVGSPPNEPPPYDEYGLLVPSYTRDLNAMQSAEKILTAQQRRSYVSYIFNLPASECESNTFATAAQRAEAFLRTVGKWEVSND
jgi:hypothetical protein